MWVDFKKSYTVGLSGKFTTRFISYFPPHLKRGLYLVKYGSSTIAMLLMYSTQYRRLASEH